MAKVLTDSQNYTNIANAIRDKLGVSDTYKPNEMAAAIETISGGGKVDVYEPTWDTDATERQGVVVVSGNMAFFTGRILYSSSVSYKTICTIPAEIAPPVPFEIYCGYGGQSKQQKGVIDEQGNVNISIGNRYIYFYARWPILKKTNTYQLTNTQNVASSHVSANVYGDMVFCYGYFSKASNVGNVWLDLFTVPQEIRPTGNNIPSITNYSLYGGFIPNTTNIYDTQYDPETGIIKAWIPTRDTNLFLNFAWKLNTEV